MTSLVSTFRLSSSGAGFSPAESRYRGSPDRTMQVRMPARKVEKVPVGAGVSKTAGGGNGNGNGHKGNPGKQINAFLPLDDSDLTTLENF